MNKILICDDEKEILEIFTQVLMTIEQMSKQIKYKFNHDLIDNIHMKHKHVKTN